MSKATSAGLWGVEGPQTFRGHAEMRRFWGLPDARECDGVDLEGPIAYVCEFDAGLARRVTAYLDPSQALEDVG